MRIRIANLEDTPQLMELFDGSLRNMAALQPWQWRVVPQEANFVQAAILEPNGMLYVWRKTGGCWDWYRCFGGSGRKARFASLAAMWIWIRYMCVRKQEAAALGRLCIRLRVSGQRRRGQTVWN